MRGRGAVEEEQRELDRRHEVYRRHRTVSGRGIDGCESLYWSATFDLPDEAVWWSTLPDSSS